jgi:hypothetical protein
MTPQIQVIESGITEEQAFECEELMIALAGRVDTKTGSLTNLTDGGEGVVGMDRRGHRNSNYGKRGAAASFGGMTHSDETKARMSLSQRGRIFSDEVKQKMRKPKSAQGCAAIAKARAESAHRPTETTKKRISEALTGRASPMKGRKHNAEAREKMSQQRLGLSKPKRECPHCGRAIAVNVFTRFHGDACKELMV